MTWKKNKNGLTILFCHKYLHIIVCAVVFDSHRQQYNAYQTRSISRRATLTAKRREAVSTLQNIRG